MKVDLLKIEASVISNLQFLYIINTSLSSNSVYQTHTLNCLYERLVRKCRRLCEVHLHNDILSLSFVLQLLSRATSVKMDINFVASRPRPTTDAVCKAFTPAAIWSGINTVNRNERTSALQIEYNDRTFHKELRSYRLQFK